MQERKTIVIAAVQAQQADAQQPVRFYIKKGIYRERPFIELADYYLQGESRTETVFTAGVGGRDP